MRAVLDANVLVAAVLSRSGVPARLVEAWLEGRFELVVCEQLLVETERTLTAPKLASRVDADDASAFLSLIRGLAELVSDPREPPPIRSVDPADDYLVALAARENVPLVSGDSHLPAPADRSPIFTPREFIERLG